MGIGKYKRGDYLRPIYRCNVKSGRYSVCMVMQETVSSYLVRFKVSNMNGIDLFSTAQWKRKQTLMLEKQIAEVNINDKYSYRSLIESPKVFAKSYARCTKCNSEYLVEDLLRSAYHWMYWSCPNCQTKSKRENFEILFKYGFTEEHPEEVIKDKAKQYNGPVVITNNCPNCGNPDNIMNDNINKIFRCESCGIYYIGEQPFPCDSCEKKNTDECRLCPILIDYYKKEK